MKRGIEYLVPITVSALMLSGCGRSGGEQKTSAKHITDPQTILRDEQNQISALTSEGLAEVQTKLKNDEALQVLGGVCMAWDDQDGYKTVVKNPIVWAVANKDMTFSFITFVAPNAPHGNVRNIELINGPSIFTKLDPNGQSIPGTELKSTEVNIIREPSEIMSDNVIHEHASQVASAGGNWAMVGNKGTISETAILNNPTSAQLENFCGSTALTGIVS